MKYVSLCLMLFASSVALATGPTPTIQLPNMAKAQTGVYFVSQDSGIIQNTGVILEYFLPGETLTESGGELDVPFLFGGYYNSTGQYYTISGPVTGTVASVDINRVQHDSEGATVNVPVGIGIVQADPAQNGNAHVMNFDFIVNEDVNSKDNQYMNGQFIRVSDTPITACVEVLGDPSLTEDEPTLVTCLDPSPEVE